MTARLVPIHIFTVRYPDGTTRRKAIPGTYCQGSACRTRLEARLPAGATIDHGATTWRSDYRYITHPSNSQTDYQTEPAQPAVAQVIELHPTPQLRAA